MQVGKVKCWCGSWKLATVDAKRCRLGRKFITLSVHLTCLQHVRLDAARRAGLSATADPCYYLLYASVASVMSPAQLSLTAAAAVLEPCNDI